MPMGSGSITSAGVGTILRLDPALDLIVPTSANVVRLGGGFAFTEGPLWIHDGYLIFSDIPNNVINRWTKEAGFSLFLSQSGFDGSGPPPGRMIGSNGLTLDKMGRLTICETGNRRVTRLEKDHSRTVLADRYHGKRLNSPNDLVYRSDGSLYFTDPPYGLEGQDEDAVKELSFNGIYRLAEGDLQLLYAKLPRPNGLAFSPDEKLLYVANSERDMYWIQFDVQPDGSLTNESLFYDVMGDAEPGVPDGVKVDQAGNVYCTGPGGVLIFSSEAKHLGTIKTPEVAANIHWGDDDARTLYITAQTSVYEVQLRVPGVRP